MSMKTNNFLAHKARGLCAVLLSAILALYYAPLGGVPCAWAAGDGGSGGGDGWASLNITDCVLDGSTRVPLEGVTFDLYCIGRVDDSGAVVLADGFEGSYVSLADFFAQPDVTAASMEAFILEHNARVSGALDGDGADGAGDAADAADAAGDAAGDGIDDDAFGVDHPDDSAGVVGEPVEPDDGADAQASAGLIDTTELILPDYSPVTDANGVAAVPSIYNGVYLMASTTAQLGEKYYRSSACFVVIAEDGSAAVQLDDGSLPVVIDGETGHVVVKNEEFTPQAADPDTVSVAALKVWDDSEFYAAVDDGRAVLNDDGTYSVVNVETASATISDYAGDVAGGEDEASDTFANADGDSADGTGEVSEDGTYGIALLADDGDEAAAAASQAAVEAANTYGPFEVDSTGAVVHEPVSVSLCKDGQVVETVQLSADNNWRYEWSGLEAGADWQVFEDGAGLPAGYTRTTQMVDDVFVVTNAFTPGDPAAVPPAVDEPEPDEPEPDEPTADTPVTDKPGQITTTTGKPSQLVQTGQLWWPVAVLGCAGVVCLLTSALLRRRE
jgi:hypothetical protein